MKSDGQCTLWLDGIPTWLGGSGDEWLHCCVAHDNGGTDVELLNCVANSGFPIMGWIMFAGLLTFGVVYRLIAKQRAKK